MSASFADGGAGGDSPFLPGNEAGYRRWRRAKLQAQEEDPPGTVPIADPWRLQGHEREALLAGLRRRNFALYRTAAAGDGRSLVRALGGQLGLHRLDANLCADEDSITPLSVAAGPSRRGGYVPYTNRPLSWHTDGYYNAAGAMIRGMVLHCQRPALEGGENRLLDHELLYIQLRDRDPAWIRALMHPEAMTIPPNTEGGEEIRGARTGPVFSVDPRTGDLHMRYSARARNVIWREDPALHSALAAMRELLADDNPWVVRHRLAAGEGVVSNNVLHNRTGFRDHAEPGRGRLLFRARYYDRIEDTGWPWTPGLAGPGPHRED